MWAHALHHSAWFGISLLSNDFFSSSGFRGWVFLCELVGLFVVWLGFFLPLPSFITGLGLL